MVRHPNLKNAPVWFGVLTRTGVVWCFDSHRCGFVRSLVRSLRNALGCLLSFGCGASVFLVVGFLRHVACSKPQKRERKVYVLGVGGTEDTKLLAGDSTPEEAESGNIRFFG